MVDGDMVPHDDVLRRLPACIPPTDRLRLEALIFASDIMEVALGRLENVGLNYDPISRESEARVALFTDAWTIIDQVHVVRQVLQALITGEKHSETQAYLDDFEVAHFLRNKMDHLSQMLPLRANRKASTTPMFGVISYFIPDAQQWEVGLNEGQIRGSQVLISAGSTPTGEWSGLLFPQGEIRLPIGAFRLDAFDRSISLDGATMRLRPVLRRLSDHLVKSIAEELDCLSTKSGVTREALEASTGGHMSLRAEISIEIERPHQN